MKVGVAVWLDYRSTRDRRVVHDVAVSVRASPEAFIGRGHKDHNVPVVVCVVCNNKAE